MAKAEPAVVLSDGTGSTTITDLVMDPSIPANFTGNIVVDLTDIDPVLGTPTMSDAGGGYYTHTTPIPVDTAEGIKTIVPDRTFARISV